MQYIVINIQDQNWEDDGGAHDPFLTLATPQEIARLQSMDGDPLDAEDQIITELHSRKVINPTYPITVSWVGAVWTSYE